MTPCSKVLNKTNKVYIEENQYNKAHYNTK